MKIYLGLRGHDPRNESAWQQTVSEVMSETVSQNSPSTWPILMFLSLLVAAPYMVHKLVNNVKTISTEGIRPIKNLFQNQFLLHIFNKTYFFSFFRKQSKRMGKI